MKLVLIGGGGHVARAAAKVIRSHPLVSRIVFADIDAAAAAESAAAAGDKGVSLRLDVRDCKALAQLLTGARCVLNLAGPYFEFGPLVLAAAMAAKVDYLDICDDWEPTLEMLEMGGAAEKAGITAILGMGSSPGISNLLATKAMSRLSRVDKVYTLWQAGEPDRGFVQAHTDHKRPGRASAALVHGVIQMTGKIRAFRGGTWTDVTPLSKVDIDVPELGLIRGAIFGHPEPITLPRFARVRDEALCLVMLTQSWHGLHERYIFPLNEQQNIDYQQAADAYLNGASAFIDSGGLVLDNTFAMIPRSFAYAEGEAHGVSKTVSAYLTGRPAGGMPEVTGTPLAVALSMMLDGQLSKPGVWAPEDCIDVERFFERYRAYCVMSEDKRELVHLAER